MYFSKMSFALPVIILLQPEGGIAAQDHVAIRAAAVLGTTPTIDGRLDEAVWSRGHAPTAFVQRLPTPGDRSAFPTGVQVLYGGGALYVGMRMFDTAPDSISTQLTRRDISGRNSDWAHVYVDSFDDGRTAFQFSVNPSGVEVDVLHFRDNQQDIGWDAVWSVATQVDSLGWTAEFRIPLSQLRFASPDGAEASWGVNFAREIARYGELAYWAPISAEDPGFVSQFGRLEGLVGVVAPQRLEVRPYTLSQLTRAPGQSSNPFHSANRMDATFGADVRYGLTSDFTLDLTINPDFGQVEADPSLVNLSPSEAFFSEKREFFTEGAELFRLTFPSWPPLLHSRRIGRAPQGHLPTGAVFPDVPTASTILAAGKVTGKTPGGLSVGVVSAVTQRETARYLSSAGDTLFAPVEPMTSYAAARVTQDFRGGQSAVGGMFTATNRIGTSADFPNLHTAAYVGALDGRHRFQEGHYEIAGSTAFSYVRGAPTAIYRTQTSPTHYFQRPNAGHLALDADRTSMAGTQSGLRVAKVGGGHWRWETTGIYTSPGYHMNDLGFQFESDQIMTNQRLGYDQFNPTGPFRRWRLDATHASGWTTGGERRYSWLQLMGNGQFKNFWDVNFGLDRTFPGLSITSLRGGPALRSDGYIAAWLNVNTDRRKGVALGLSSFGQVSDQDAGHWLHVQPSVTVRPSSRAQLSLEPRFTINHQATQYVGTHPLSAGPTYVFGRLHHTTAALTARLSYTFNPKLSLQVYAQPFVSSGRYTEFQAVADPQAAQRHERFVPLTDVAFDGEENRYAGAVAGEPVGFPNPDFSFAQLRSNVVLRWEYRPGSTLFLVWGQDRATGGPDGTFDLGRDMRQLFDAPGTNVFLLKLNYWIGQ